MSPSSALSPEEWRPLESERDPAWTKLFAELEGVLTDEQTEQVRLVAGGDVTSSTSRLLVGDLLVSGADLPPLELNVEPGEYPTYQAVWDTPDSGPRVVAALLVLSAESPVRWEKRGAFLVDSGSAGFGDAETVRHFDEHDQGERLVERWKPGPKRLAHAFRVRKGERIVVSETGWGDGVYGVYAGVDDAGAVLAVVAGFGILRGDASTSAEIPPPPSRLRRDRLLLAEGFAQACRRKRESRVEALRPYVAEDVCLESLSEALPVPPLDLDPFEEPPESGRFQLRVSIPPYPSRIIGVVVIRIEGGKVVEVELPDRFKTAEELTPKLEKEEATGEDRDLVERLGAMEDLRPMQRMFVKDLLATVRSGSALTAGQRERAEKLLAKLSAGS